MLYKGSSAKFIKTIKLFIYVESIDTLLNEVKPGDLIKLHLDGHNRTFVGYVWYTKRDDFLKVHNTNIHPRWAENPVIDTDESAVYLSSLNPDALEPGTDSLRSGVQLVGIDYSGSRKGTIQGIKIKGYEVLERCKNLYLPDFSNH